MQTQHQTPQVRNVQANPYSPKKELSLAEKVDNEIKEGTFSDYAAAHIDSFTEPAERIREKSALWSAVVSHVTDVRYAAAEAQYGHKVRFSPSGIFGLSQDEVVALNKGISDQVKPYQEALDFLSEIKTGNILDGVTADVKPPLESKPARYRASSGVLGVARL